MFDAGGPRRVPRAEWSPVPRPGSANVASRLLMAEAGLALALLKFDPEGTIDEHAAGHEIDVFCLEGEGFISIEHRVCAFLSGDTLRWPAGRVHRLWTGDKAMITLMVEHL